MTKFLILLQYNVNALTGKLMISVKWVDFLPIYAQWVDFLPTVNYQVFARVLFLPNFVHAEFRGNETLVKW